jgi:hypothetical protein
MSDPVATKCCRLASLASLALLLTIVAMHGASAQRRNMDQPYTRDELAGSDQSLRRVQQDQPRLFDQIVNDVNQEENTRNPATPEELAGATPALEDLNRSSPEALLGLFLLLKGAAKAENKGAR